VQFHPPVDDAQRRAVEPQLVGVLGVGGFVDDGLQQSLEAEGGEGSKSLVVASFVDGLS
jgi:hypothetical protein